MEKLILAIETSCDETAISVLKGHKTILSNVISSQIKDHQINGGVVPELASRLHLTNIDIVFKEALNKANISMDKIDLIAVVNGPGLIGALHVGVVFAKSLAFINNKPILPLNHIAGHIYANSLVDDFEFPLLSLVVSGGHTQLVLMKNHLCFEIIGQTLDDAIGECYDKVARVLKLGYPGGPLIDELAKNGQNIYNFPKPLLDKTYNFSYSGLKSAVINKINQLNMKSIPYKIEDIACSFQESAIEPLITKTLMAIEEYNIKQVVLAGGVSANSYLRKTISDKISANYKNVKLTLPPMWACTDNSIMIAALASYYDDSNYLSSYDFDVNPNRKLD